jgi:hypothetical protein
MKKITILVLVTFFLSINSKGQITKGNWLLGGNLAYSKLNSEGNDAINSKSRNIDIMSNIGYFLYDKLAAGIKLNTLSSKQKYPQVNGTYNTIVQNRIGIGPFIRYYFLGTDERVNIFSDAGILYSYLSNRSTSSVEKSLEYSISAGTVIFLNTSVGLEFLLAYNNTKVFNIDAKGETFQFKIGFQIHLEKE